MSSSYTKARADKKKKLRNDYNEKLFSAASLVLPSVVIRASEDTTSAELVDEAILIARDLLAALGYKYIGEPNEE